jgi:4-carboxymuconolactone decarboxylase
MRIRLACLLVAVLPAVAAGQEKLPPDIHPVTLSRMPPINRAELDAEGQKALDARATPPTPAPGPGGVTVWSPRSTEGLGVIGRALGVPRGDTFPLGGRMFQLIVLITAREIDQQYEWSAHEPAGLRVGLEQSVIDAVKYNRDVTGLAARDALVIRYFRALMREHKVSSELWAAMVKEFGRQRIIDMMMLMADYFTVGTMMNAVDQHLPPDRKPLLPPRAR